MLDINFIRDNAELIKEAARKKHIDFAVDDLLMADDQRRTALRAIEDMRAEQNTVSEEIARLEGKDREEKIRHMQGLKEKLKEKEKTLKEIMNEWRMLMLQVPNIPDVSVPEGATDAENKEIKKWGEIPKFSFEPKSHIELLEAANMLDLERGAKVSGFRGYFLKNDAVRLTYALWHFVFEFLTKRDRHFIPTLAPSLVRREPLLGTGLIPQSEEDLYKTQDGDYLAGTSEVAMMGYHMDEVLEKEQFPIKFLAFSPCFRREAGAHGKDTKGIMRVHEFFKFEQVVLCEASHEESVKYHEELTKNSESLMQELDIPYRIVLNCGGDLGLGQVKKYDIETWVPSEQKYRESHSSSYFHDFQTRRLNIRYRDEKGKLKFAHSLNNTALASPRILISIVENNQKKDGSIEIPKVLQQYVGKEKIGK